MTKKRFLRLLRYCKGGTNNIQFGHCQTETKIPQFERGNQMSLDLTKEELFLLRQAVQEEIKEYEKQAEIALNNPEMKERIKELVIEGTNELLAKYGALLKKLEVKE